MKKVISMIIVICLISTGFCMFSVIGENEDEINKTKTTRGGQRGNILFVGPGQTYTTIGTAIIAANMGDTIKVLAGVYNENVVIDKVINLIGNGKANTTIDGNGNGDVVKITANWVNITGFTITNGGGNFGDSGIELEDVQHCQIYNNNVSLNKRNGIMLSSSSSKNEILGNNVSLNGEYGIWTWSSSNNIIKGNNVSSNDRTGIGFTNSAYNSAATNNFTKNGITITGISQEHFNSHNICLDNLVNDKPIYYYKNKSNIDLKGKPVGQVILANCTGINLNNLHINNTDIGVIIAYSSDITLNNSNISNNLCSLSVDYSSYLTIKGNTFFNNEIRGGYGSSGFWIRYLNHSTISFNNFSEIQGHGIRLINSSNINITDNHMVGERPIYDIGISVVYDSNNNNIVNNNVLKWFFGIGINTASNNHIIGNNVSDNNYGIGIGSSSNNFVTCNNVSNNKDGITLGTSANNNRVYHNKIINNTNQAYDDASNKGNQWDNDYPSGGNYWSDYKGKDDGSGTGNHSIAGDGIGDTEIPHLGLDNYPFTSPGFISNLKPIANAGPDQNVTLNQTVYFNGSGSYDPGGEDLNYKWYFGDGTSTGWQSDCNTSHVYKGSENYLEGITINESKTINGLSAINSAFIINGNLKVNGTLIVYGPLTVTINGSIIITVNGSVIVYGSFRIYGLVKIYGSVKVYGVFSVSGLVEIHGSLEIGNKTYVVTLTVSDGSLIDNDTCIIYVISIGGYTAPIFTNSLPDIELYEDGPPKDNAIDLWNYVMDEETFTNQLNFSIIGNTHPECGVTLDSNRYIDIKPDVNWHGSSTVTIQVSDGNLTATQNFLIIVIPVNDKPIADAGPNQNVIANQTVYFDGSKSYDIDNTMLTYNWDFGDGTSTGWQSDCNSSHIYIFSGNYTVTVIVNDGELTDSSNCKIHVIGQWVKNLPPVAKAYASKKLLKFDEKVTLYANESYDPNGDLLTYKWRSNIDGLFGEGEIIIEIILSLGKHNITLEVADGFHTSFDYLEIIVFKPGENDTDGDSYPDDIDAFPNDPTQWQDSDGDGYGDNLSGNNPDLFPDNVTEWADTDGDGYGDNSDAYPNDPTKYELEPGEEDSDGDGHPDSTDAFPYDPNEWIDTDGDGVGDNSDAFPNDPNRYKKETTQDYLIEIILITSVIIILIIIISLKLFIQRPKRQRLSKTDFDDEMLNTVRHKILHGETLQELEYSRDEIEGMLDRKFKAGNISIHTYNLIKKEILCSDEAQFGQMNNSKLRGKE